MKSILIIATSEKNLAPFKKAAQQFRKDIFFVTWDKIAILEDNPDCVLAVDDNGKVDLQDFSLIYVRNVGPNREKMALVSDYIAETPLVDDILRTGGRRDSKAFQYRKFFEAGLPIIPFIYGSLDLILSKSDTFGFPFILKRSRGQQGKQVFLVHNQNQLTDFCREFKNQQEEGYYFLAQKFVKNDGDFRFLVIDGQCLGVMKRTVQKKDEFRNNISLGGKGKQVNLPDEVIDLATRAAKVSRLDIAGVDVIIDGKGVPYILEINSAPQFEGFQKATGIDVAAKIIAFLIKKSHI